MEKLIYVMLVASVFGVYRLSSIRLFLLSCLLFSARIAFPQNSEDEILRSYVIEGRIYFDSVARVKNNDVTFERAEVQCNLARLMVYLKKASDDTQNKNDGYTALTRNFDKTIKTQFDFPPVYFEKVGNRLSHGKVFRIYTESAKIYLRDSIISNRKDAETLNLVLAARMLASVEFDALIISYEESLTGLETYEALVSRLEDKIKAKYKFPSTYYINNRKKIKE